MLRDVAVATNHQGDVEWLEHARATRSLERERRILATLDEAHDLRGFAAAFQRPPLFSADYASGLGTLYTAIYQPVSGSVEFRWPGLRWQQAFGRFQEGSRTVSLPETTAA